MTATAKTQRDMAGGAAQDVARYVEGPTSERRLATAVRTAPIVAKPRGLGDPPASAEASLSPGTLLQLAPNVRTRFDAAGHVLVDCPDGTVIDVGPRGYGALSLFVEPSTLADAIDHLEAADRLSTDFLPALSVINMLMDAGALLRSDRDRRPTGGWADPVEHARMLHDDRRTRDYIAAISQAVQPGDVVLDLGTGSGVLAVAAARAGARHVYAVEASDIADVAERVFALNRVRDRVTLVRGWSRQIELPEKADLLVSEIIGNEPFEEEILETTLDARRRLLAPRARLIPNTLTLLARPVVIPTVEARDRAIGHASVARWRRLYGIDFQPLLDAADAMPVLAPTEGEVVAGWLPAGPPVVLAELDLATFEDASLDATADLVVKPHGSVNAVVVTFRADLHDAISHTLDPWTWARSSWATAVWVLPNPIHVGPGAALRVRYSRRTHAKPDALTCDVVETYTQMIGR